MIMPGTIVGDTKGDGIVNGQDLAAIASTWTQTGKGLVADLNADQIVNGQDLALVASNWLNHGVVPIPEPPTLILAAGALLLSAVRRKLVCAGQRRCLDGY
jgi:hypothetical protein